MPRDRDNRAWYLIYTKPRSEQRACSRLNEQGYVTYLPRCRVNKVYRSKRTVIIETAFPNYLFIRLDEQLDNWAPIRSTPGVNHLVRFGAMPARVPEEFIEAMQSNEDAEGYQQMRQPILSPGDPIRIVAGPMAGLEAIYSASKGSDRVLIMLDIIGKLTRVELKYVDIEKK